MIFSFFLLLEWILSWRYVEVFRFEGWCHICNTLCYNHVVNWSSKFGSRFLGIWMYLLSWKFAWIYDVWCFPLGGWLVNFLHSLCVCVCVCVFQTRCSCNLIDLVSLCGNFQLQSAIEQKSRCLYFERTKTGMILLLVMSTCQTWMDLNFLSKLGWRWTCLLSVSFLHSRFRWI